MKILHFIPILLVCGLTFTQELSDELLAKKDSIWFSQNPESQPIWETLKERKTKDAYFAQRRLKAIPTPKLPSGAIRFVAEFERMSSVIVRYPFGITVEVIKELASDLKVFCLATTANQAAARSAMQAGGVDMAQVQFINVATDSYWTRDFSPWPIFDAAGKAGLVDFTYNRPRPNDDAVGPSYSTALGLPLYNMDLIHVGGNFMGDSYTIGSSSSLIYKENLATNSIDSTTVNQRMANSLGIQPYYTTADPTGNYIEHIDCWGKFLAPDKVLICRVAPSHAQYAKIEATAKYYSQKKSAYGKPYRVYRVETPNFEPYTNSLILNDKLIMATMGTSQDAAALEVYKKAMPGYKVMGYRGTWESTDALHCRTFGIVDLGLLHILHYPLIDTVIPTAGKFMVSATITSHSGKGLIPDSIALFYKIGAQATFTKVALSATGNSNYSGSIPAPTSSSQIAYYLHAADSSGRRENHPFIGEPDPHQFYAWIGTNAIAKKSPKNASEALRSQRLSVTKDGRYNALGKVLQRKLN